jgi:hypothetical protein
MCRLLAVYVRLAKRALTALAACAGAQSVCAACRVLARVPLLRPTTDCPRVAHVSVLSIGVGERRPGEQPHPLSALLPGTSPPSSSSLAAGEAEEVLLTVPGGCVLELAMHTVLEGWVSQTTRSQAAAAGTVATTVAAGGGRGSVAMGLGAAVAGVGMMGERGAALRVAGAGLSAGMLELASQLHSNARRRSTPDGDSLAGRCRLARDFLTGAECGVVAGIY